MSRTNLPISTTEDRSPLKALIRIVNKLSHSKLVRMLVFSPDTFKGYSWDLRDEVHSLSCFSGCYAGSLRARSLPLGIKAIRGHKQGGTCNVRLLMSWEWPQVPTGCLCYWWWRIQAPWSPEGSRSRGDYRLPLAEQLAPCFQCRSPSLLLYHFCSGYPAAWVPQVLLRVLSFTCTIFPRLSFCIASRKKACGIRNILCLEPPAPLLDENRSP